MKTKKRIGLFVIVSAISITTTLNISFSGNQNEKILTTENIEALANKENHIPDDVEAMCSVAGGNCLAGTVEYFGIRIADD